MNTTDKTQWIAELKNTLNGPRKRVGEEKFRTLIYKIPPNPDSQIVDAIMESFLNPFDSSVMQACTTTLSGISFKQYYESLLKILPQLLNQDPDSALCLLNYPGFELRSEHIRTIGCMIKKTDPTGVLKAEIDYQINQWNLKDDEPWLSIYHYQ